MKTPNYFNEPVPAFRFVIQFLPNYEYPIMKKISTILISLLTSLFIANAAYALTLAEAKQQGLVGEQITGYLGTVTTNAETTALVQTINAKRKQKYKEIAERNGTSLESVEQLAGKTALEKTPVGQFINLGSGWQKK